MGSLVLMPKAAMHEDRLFVRPANNVGLPRQFFGMKAIAIAKCVDNFADGNLGLCLRCPYAAHVFGAARDI